MRKSVHKGYNIYHHLRMEVKPNVVYDAVTMPEHLNNWWPLRSSGKPKAGAEYNFYFGDEYNWFGNVIDFKPNRTFHIKMTTSDEDWKHTSFGFDLEEDEKGTKVTFQHIDWPRCNTHFKTASYCWAILLKDLKNYVEKGTVVPFEERS